MTTRSPPAPRVDPTAVPRHRAALARLARATVRTVSVALLGASAEAALARPDDYRVNLREACRQGVAGAYLNLYDGKIQNEHLAQAASERLSETEQALAGARAALKAADAAYQDKSKAFDVAIAARRDAVAATLENLEHQHAQYVLMRDEALAKARAAEGEEMRARGAIATVFKIERAEDRRDGGYPLNVAYKAECPKFRYLCTLPAGDAAALESLAVGSEVLESCRRYAGLSRAGSGTETQRGAKSRSSGTP